MVTVQRKADGSKSPQVHISNTAINMISSLHHADKKQVNKTISQLTFTVKDDSKAAPLVGVKNAYVAKAGDLRVIFKRDGTSIVIESIVKRS